MENLQHWWEFQKPMKLIGEESLVQLSNVYNLESNEDTSREYGLETSKQNRTQVLAESDTKNGVSTIQSKIYK